MITITTIFTAFVFGLAFGCGAMLSAALLRLLPSKTDDTHKKHLQKLSRRNELLEESNVINRIAASHAFDMKKILQAQHEQFLKDVKSRDANEKLETFLNSAEWKRIQDFLSKLPTE